MTRPPGTHLSPDEIDSWLAGNLASEWQQHLDHCQECLERVRAEREIVDQLAGLQLMSPTTGFADRVMAAVTLPDPFAIRSIEASRRRLFASRKSLAVAASVILVLVGSMAGSIAWSLTHPQTLASIGHYLLLQGEQIAWLSLRGVASNLMEQPWYSGLQSLISNPGRLAVGSAVISSVYLVGILALRRLLALPTQQVAHAGI
jgi:anti-sigma factor RsiW